MVETDIANCFEAIDHEKLMQAVEERVVDRSVLKLLRAMLRAGVMEDGQVRRPVCQAPGFVDGGLAGFQGGCWGGSGGVERLVLGWRDVSEFAVEAALVEPVDVLGDGDLDVVDAGPWALVAD